MGKEWIKIKEIGQLYLEKVLVTFDFPILFVCVDYENRKYLCLNVDDETGKSVIVATDNKHLINMLSNKIPMESVFRNSLNGKVIIAEYDSDNDEIISYTEEAMKVSKSLLPKENAYFELCNTMIEEYVAYLSKQIIKIDIESFCEKKTFVIPKSVFVSTFAVGDIIACNCGRVMIEETEKRCSYSITKNDRMIA